MKGSFEELTEQLKDKNIRLSYQRLKVLEYINNNRTHPTVDQIYTKLHKEIPTLSKTTIYNTLKLLMEAGMVTSISIDDNEARYDIDTDDHGHFKCEVCGDVYDFDIDISSLPLDDLANFQINQKAIYFKGICPECKDR